MGKQDGFSFVEVVIASFLSAFLLAGAAALWYYFVNSYDFSFEESRALSIASDNVRVLVQELREVQNGMRGEYPLAVVDDQEIVFHSDIDNDNQTERIRYYLVGDMLMKQVYNYTPGESFTYPCQDGCTICHNGDQTLNVDEHAWPAHANHGDSLGACGTGGGSGGGYGENGVYERIVAEHIRNGARPIFTYYNGSWPGDVVNNPLGPGRLINTRYIEVELFARTHEGTVGPAELSISNAVHLRNLKDNL